MRIKLSDLRRIIREEARHLHEAPPPELDPSTFAVDPETMRFSVQAKKSRPGETGPPEQELGGQMVSHGGRYLPKPDPAMGYGEEEGPGTMRSLTGQVSAQLKDAIDSLMGAAPQGDDKDRETKGKKLGKALKKVVDAAEKIEDEEVKAVLLAAVEVIKGTPLGFDIKMED